MNANQIRSTLAHLIAYESNLIDLIITNRASMDFLQPILYVGGHPDWFSVFIRVFSELEHPIGRTLRSLDDLITQQQEEYENLAEDEQTLTPAQLARHPQHDQHWIEHLRQLDFA